MEEEGETIEIEPSRTVEEKNEPNNLKPSLIVKGERVHSGLDIENEISMNLSMLDIVPDCLLYKIEAPADRFLSVLRLSTYNDRVNMSRPNSAYGLHGLYGGDVLAISKIVSAVWSSESMDGLLTDRSGFERLEQEDHGDQPIMEELKKRADADKNDKSVEDLVLLLFSAGKSFFSIAFHFQKCLQMK
ncbi:hypothetical protein Scep_003779 [Stephania cephalantha]|uniref:Uncharacterized protein n=1 Tax=Stephania cephalantha TaxID=152367 RepID=A0AAP0KS32_9MAGN